MATLEQFELARKRAAQQSRAAQQQSQEAIKRRFASLGAASSGASLKQEQLAGKQAREEQARAEEGITAAESEERQRQAEITQAREFSKAEREAGQSFQSQQAEAARKFAIGEREAQESFQLGESEKTRAFQDRVQAWTESQGAKQLQLALDQFDYDKYLSEYGVRLGTAQAVREGITREELGVATPGGDLQSLPNADLGSQVLGRFNEAASQEGQPDWNKLRGLYKGLPKQQQYAAAQSLKRRMESGLTFTNRPKMSVSFWQKQLAK